MLKLRDLVITLMNEPPDMQGTISDIRLAPWEIRFPNLSPSQNDND